MGEGIDKVKDGKAFGFFSIPYNFTANYVAKYVLFRTITTHIYIYIYI